MKILYLLQSTRFSGAENVVCQIIRMMKKDSDKKLIYCSPDGQIREALEERGIEYEPLKKLTVKEVKGVIEKHHPDVIHANDRSACVVAAMATKKIPIIAHVHVNNNSGITCFAKNLIFSCFAKKYTHVFWVSESAYEQFKFKRILKNKSSILYNVIDIKELYDKADRDDLTYDYDIVYVGRLSYQKNPQRLMKVLDNVSRQNPEAKIVIVGNGEYEQYVADYIKDNKLADKINYLGYLNNPLKLIRSSKALVMTSRFEGTPMVALEAQCLGVPIVSTPVDGMKKVIENGYNGYLTDNDAEIVSRLEEIITDEKIYRKLSENSLKKAVEYNDMEKYYAAIEKAYRVYDIS